MRAFIVALALISSLTLCAQSGGLLGEISYMSGARAYHQSARLNAGTAIAAGGWMEGEVTASTEIYDLATNLWTMGPDMNVPRTTFAMISLHNGYVLAAGGWDGGGTNYSSTEIYDSEDNMWMPGPSLSVGRADLVATRLLDGRILFTGGFDGVTNTTACDVYDPVSNTMTPVASMSYGRSMHAAMLMSDGRVLVAGGFNPDYGFQMDECEIYDPFLDTWTDAAPLPLGRDNPGYFGSRWSRDGFVVGGRVFNGLENLYEGVDSFDVYDAETNSWTSFALPAEVSYGTVGETQGDGDGFEVYLFSGVDQTGNGVETQYVASYAMFPFGFQDAYETLDGLEPRWNASVCNLSEPGSISDYFLISGGDEGEFGSAQIWYRLYVSVDEHEMTTWGCFPNPVIDNAFLSGSERISSWTVFDMNGKQVASGNANVVELSHLTAGSYVIQVEGENSKQTITIQKR